MEVWGWRASLLTRIIRDYHRWQLKLAKSNKLGVNMPLISTVKYRPNNAALARPRLSIPQKITLPSTAHIS
jgi:hypothetical protein